MFVHMLRSLGEHKVTKRFTITARCGTERAHRRSDSLPDDFTGWESDVSCPACVLPETTT